MPTTDPSRDQRVQELMSLAADQEGVVSRRQAYRLGVTRWQIRAHLRAGRWQTIGDQSICVHNGPLGERTLHWAAVFQGGPRAQLDGASSLRASGLERFETSRIRVTVPRGARVRRHHQFDIRQTRRWSADDLVASGVPRTRAPVAAVRGALWARSDRQAALLLAMAVQQGIATPESIAEEMLRIRRDKRRTLVQTVIIDLLGGARSLGEIDVARECRRRGLPEPSRQVLRRDKRNRYYLDVYWDDFHLVVEVDGIQHSWVDQILPDALRQNALSISGERVLRLPLLGMRIASDEFFEQVGEALRAAGWQRPDNVMRGVA